MMNNTPHGFSFPTSELQREVSDLRSLIEGAAHTVPWEYSLFCDEQSVVPTDLVLMALSRVSTSLETAGLRQVKEINLCRSVLNTCKQHIEQHDEMTVRDDFRELAASLVVLISRMQGGTPTIFSQQGDVLKYGGAT
jgi:hypothetical protein